MKFKKDITGESEFFNEDRTLIIVKDAIKCPYCKELINMRLPNVHRDKREALTECYKCHKQFVINAKVENVIIKYDLKIRKVGR